LNIIPDFEPGTEIQPGPFYQYPTSGVLPLLEDSTYYWRVVALIPTSSDPTHPLEMSSTIWAFKIARMTPGQTDFVAAQTNAFFMIILLLLLKKYSHSLDNYMFINWLFN
jgi:hypothetical protein